MTAIIGFVNQKYIIVASDSQMSRYPHSTAKQGGYPKLATIEFDGPHYALISKAGSISAANHFQDLFEEEAKKMRPDKPSSIANLAETVLKRVRSEIMSIFLEAQPWSDDSKMQRMVDYHCEIMLAYYFNEVPYIYTLTSDACFADRQKQSFAAIGSGANVASSVLTGFDLRVLPSDQACALAVYAIEVCKKNDLGCGGDVQMSILGRYTDHQPFFFEREVLADYERASARTGLEIQAALAEKLATNFREDRIRENKIRWLTVSGKEEPPIS